VTRDECDFVGKLCDFGHAREVGRREVLQGICGTPSFRSPENESGRCYDGFKSDMFSVGRTLSAWLTFPTPEQKWMIHEMTDRDPDRRPKAQYALSALYADAAFVSPDIPNRVPVE